MTFAANLASLARRAIAGAGDLIAFDASGKYPAGDGSQLTNMLSLGAGQTLQDLTASRISGTTYQNITGKTMVVIVQCSAPSASGVSLYTGASGGSLSLFTGLSLTAGYLGFGIAIVNNLEFYQGSGTITKWWEYRL